MLRKISGALLACLFLAVGSLSAQQKRSLTHDDYDGWESLGSSQITKDGKWVGYMISPQEGDGRLEILPFKDVSKKFVIPRAQSWSFSPDGTFAVGKIEPQADSVRLLKLKKTKKDDMPKDSLFIYQMSNGNLEKMANVKSFSIPQEEGSWIAIQFEKEKPAKKDPSDSTNTEKPKKTDGTNLLVRSLDGSKSYEFERVKSYGFSKNGDFLQYVLAEEDTLDNSAIQLLNLATGESSLLHEGNTSYERVSFSPESKYLAFISTNDSAKAEKPYYEVFLTTTASPDVNVLIGNETPGLLEDSRISSDASIRFSEDESRMFFGVMDDYVDYAYESDTTILDEDRVSLDIWGWQDAEIQPMQLRNKSREQKRTYTATIDLNNKQIAQLEDREVNNVILESKIEKDFAIAWTDAPYRRNYSWDIQIGRDLYAVDFETGDRTLIEENISGYPSLSPEGKYVSWYSGRDSSWVAYDLEAKKHIDLTEGIQDVVFYDELHDSPSLPGSYGSAGWLADDAALLIYDRFDIWKIDPKNPSAAVNITAGEGRKQMIQFRRQDLDREERSIDPKAALYLTAFNEVSKESGMFGGKINGGTPTKIMMTPHRYYGLTKAEDSDEIMIRRSTYQENPDLYLGDLSFKSLKKASDLNPQQEGIKWGSVELVDYLANDGTPLQGLLFKPEYFDENKKYPMMVYFYERNSDGLYSYRTPAPSASTINIPYFVSNDYVVFVPDIKYELGLPGPSAYDCIIPGVQSVVAKGFVDKENMAIQGQSWGGYQVAYLITQTDMFKAAGAGAPVVNMTSAYGGIRWGTGMSRMFQYEQTQSRIGGTIWQKPLYYIENSPLFFMDRVNTPVLIMHNDEDGAVPWYQGIEMFMALKRLNQPAWLLQYNGEDHNLRQRKNRKDLSVRLSQFFDHYLKGAPAPLWMTEGLPAVEKGRTLKYELNDN